MTDFTTKSSISFGVAGQYAMIVVSVEGAKT